MKARKQLIVNADDLGYDPAVSEGILEAMHTGVVSSATFMVNTPFAREAARSASGLAIGLHLNLARWAPLSGAIPAALLEGGELDEAQASRLSAEMAASETEAQLDELQRLLGRPATHIDVHKHLHRHPAVLEGLARVAARRRLPVRALDAAMRASLTNAGVRTTDHFIGDAGKQAYWTLEQWRSSLKRLDGGVTELMCHPGHVPSQVKSGYSAQREIELKTLLSAEAKAALREEDIELADFRLLAA